MENDIGATTPTEAAGQLAVLDADRAAVADRAMQPWWYDAALGLAMAGFIASYSVHRDWVSPVALMLFLACNVALMAVYKRITGFWVNTQRAGCTQRVTRIWLAGAAVVLAVAGGAEFGLGVQGAMVVAGVVLGVGVAVISRWWTRVYIAELRAGL